MGKTPRRRCIVCRKDGTKESLVRFCADGGQLVWDEDMCRGGRGAYVHRTVECLTRAHEAGRWAQALRVAREALDLRALDRVRESVIEAPPLSKGRK